MVLNYEPNTYEKEIILESNNKQDIWNIRWILFFFFKYLKNM